MYAHVQCLAMGPDFVPATQMSEHVVFDMGELKTKVLLHLRITCIALCK